MPESTRMICPDCGVEMNHHADKLVYADEPDGADAALGGTIEEAHTCPACGQTLLRREEEGEAS